MTDQFADWSCCLFIVIFFGGVIACVVMTFVNFQRAGEGGHPNAWIALLFPITSPFMLWLSISALRERRAQEERNRLDEEARQRRLEEFRRQRAIEEQVRSHKALVTFLNKLVDESRRLAGDLPGLVDAAEHDIAKAEHEFSEGAFAPFWDAIERAVKRLARFDTNVKTIINNSAVHGDKALALESLAPRFDISLELVPDASTTAARLQMVVRKAQKEPHFSMIFEQRRTNQLLVGGFSTLYVAINELASRLEVSLDQLGATVSAGLDAHASHVITAEAVMTSALTSELKRSRDQAATDAAAQRDLDERQLKLLEDARNAD